MNGYLPKERVLLSDFLSWKALGNKFLTGRLEMIQILNDFSKVRSFFVASGAKSNDMALIDLHFSAAVHV